MSTKAPSRPLAINLPNLITLLRIILTPLFVILVINHMLIEAAVTFGVAAVSDGLDGFLARTLRQKTALGSYLDPIADKLLLTSAYVSLAILGALPSWLAVIVISRDVIILVGATMLHLIHGPIPIRPLPISKLTTVFQLTTLLGVLLAGSEQFGWLNHYLTVLYAATAALTVISGLRYIFIGVAVLTAGENQAR
ncbi:MAG: CDP-alcohol phosphatidyltransferase family protein [Pseudomonadota bacterium]